jgi:hypothetical protein
MEEIAFDSYLIGGLIVLTGVILSVIGLLLVRRKVSPEDLKHYHEVASPLLSVVGTLYAVLLGLVVVDCMAKFQQAHFIVGQEANAVANIFELADGLPSAKRTQIHQLCMDYVHEVRTNEWNQMDRGTASTKAQKDRVLLYKACVIWEPITESQKAIYASLLEELSEFTDARRDRLVLSINGVSPAVWFVLLVGAACTTIFTYFFGVPNLLSQIIMTAGVSLLIGLNLLLVNFYGYPFSGDVKVYPEEFDRDEKIFKDVLSQELKNETALAGPKIIQENIME